LFSAISIINPTFMQQDPITTEDINLITEVLTELFAKVGTKVEIHPEQAHFTATP
jgi:hypothetical protein